MPNLPDSNSPSAQPLKRWFPWLIGFGLAVSLVFMAAASRGDLSLDELLTLETALGSKSWLAISLQHNDDNNHLLNTYLLRILGWQEHLFVYRIPVIVFGIYTIAALAFTARRWSRSAPIWVVFLTGWSFPIILYCSEARGYAAALFFSVVAFELLQHCREQITWPRLALFWLCLCLGFISHFSFVILLLALGLWSVAQAFQPAGSGDFPVASSDSPPCKRSLPQAIAILAKLYAAPAIFVLAVYWIFIQHLTILGGVPYTPWEVTSAATAHALGLPDTLQLRWVAVAACVFLAGNGIWLLFRQKRPEWLFFLLMLTVAPVAVAILAHSPCLGFRYFLVCFPFFYLLLAILFAEWSTRKSLIKVVPLCLLLAMTTGHLLKIDTLVELGRGGYRQALADMAAATRGDVIRVGSDSDFKNGRMLRFYGLMLPAKKVQYTLHQNIAAERPEWLVSCYLQKCPSLMVSNQLRYDLFSFYPYCGHSGLPWSVYRLAAPRQ